MVIKHWVYLYGNINQQDSYDMLGNINCAKSRLNMVAHLSHTECEVSYRKGLYPHIGGDKVTKKTIVHRRHEAAQKLMNDFRSKCIDDERVQRASQRPGKQKQTNKSNHKEWKKQNKMAKLHKELRHYHSSTLMIIKLSFCLLSELHHLVLFCVTTMILLASFTITS